MSNNVAYVLDGLWWCGFRNIRAKITCPARAPKPGTKQTDLTD